MAGAAKKKAAKRKPAAQNKTSEEENSPEQTESPSSDAPPTNEPDQGNTPPVEEPEDTGSDEEADDNGETADDREAAGEARRRKVLGVDDEVDENPDYEPTHLEPVNFDHHGAEERRQAELQRERDEHNRRTGDASLSKGSWS